MGLQEGRQAGKVRLDAPLVVPGFDDDRFGRFAADGPVQAERVAIAQRAFGKWGEAKRWIRSRVLPVLLRRDVGEACG
ncbi:hypothetical protein D3C72_1747480 [compost metagenome]